MTAIFKDVMEVPLIDFLFVATSAFLVTLYGWKKGLYSPTEPYQPKKMGIAPFLLLFFLYFGLVNLFFPLAWYVLQAQGVSRAVLSALDLFRIPFSFLALLFAMFRFYPESKSHFFPRQNITQLFLPSFGSYFISLLWGTLIAVSCQILFRKLSLDPEFQQDAVTALKEIKPSFLLFFLQGISIIIIVPIAEEILFRGFLHEALLCSFGRLPAMIMTCLLFVFVHYTPGQGLGNIPIMLALLPLAIHLVFLKEKYRSLNPSVLCHMLFNLMGVIQILLA